MHFLVGLSLMIAVSSTPAHAEVSEKCLVPLKEAMKRLEQEKIEKKPVPRECQYYKVMDLTPEDEKHLRSLINPKALELIPSTSLSVVYGALVNGSSHPGFVSAECGAIIDRYDGSLPLSSGRELCEKAFGFVMQDLKREACLSPAVEERLQAIRDKKCKKPKATF
jgi:hypothetical protein